MGLAVIQEAYSSSGLLACSNLDRQTNWAGGQPSHLAHMNAERYQLRAYRLREALTIDTILWNRNMGGYYNKGSSMGAPRRVNPLTQNPYHEGVL